MSFLFIEIIIFFKSAVKEKQFTSNEINSGALKSLPDMQLLVKSV